MVGGDDRPAALRFDGREQPAQARVDRLDRDDGGAEHAGVAHHVRIGVIHHKKVIPFGFDPPHKAVGQRAGAHLRRQIIGSHVRRRDEQSFLALERRFPPAVEEVGHMGVFLGLRRVELAKTRLRDDTSDRPFDIDGLEGRARPLPVDITCQRDELKVRRQRALETVERRFAQGREKLTHPIGPEVEEEDGVAGTYPPRPGFDSRWGDDRGLDKFVGDAVIISRAQNSVGRGRDLAFAVDDGAPRFRDPIPSPVAVHAMVAPPDAGDPPPADARERRL